MEGFDKLADKLRKEAIGQVEARVNAAMPGGIKFAVKNPDDAAGAGAADDELDDEEEGEDEGGDEGDIGSLVWEDADPEHNMACAVGAWRAAGNASKVVARHTSGSSFYGDCDDLDEYIETHGQREDDWEICEDAEGIMGMEYDIDTLREVLKMLDTTEYADAKDVYEQFHWGDQSNVTVVKQVTGVSAPLAHLGVARRIEYGAKKDGEFQEYFHEFGEDSGKFPQVYAIMDPSQKFPVALLIHGGEMRIEPRGIVE